MDAEGWLTSELASFACAACGQAYGEAHIRLIAQREELFFVDLSCPHCGSQAVAIVAIQLEGESHGLGAGRIVVSTAPEADEGPTVPPISADDVLDLHALLAEFGSDVDQLMARLDGQAR